MELGRATRLIGAFADAGEAVSPLVFSVSDIWHFNHSRGQVPFGASSGIYLYSIPCAPQWDKSPGEIDEDVLYIGKSNGDLGGRVWSHVGLIYDPDTKKACDPRFKYHQWSEDASIAESLKRRISVGDVSVVTVRFDVPVESRIPEAVEKYLLAWAVRLDGRLPALNKGL